MISTDDKAAAMQSSLSGTVSIPAGTARSGIGARLLEWPGSFWLFVLSLAVLYAPTLAHAEYEWATNDSYAHGFIIFPVAIYLVWNQRSEVARAQYRPTRWGFALLVAGLIMQTVSYLLQLRYIGMWSLPVTLAGGILLLHGRSLWRVVCFPVCFLLFAAPLPNTLLSETTLWIQQVSTTGTVWLATLLGYSLIQHGNVLQVPGLTVEIAEACSGFHKLISLGAFAMLYGYVYQASLPQRLILAALVFPIAIFSNVLRITALIAAGSAWGLPGMHAAHDPAEYCAIFIAFVMFVVAGRLLGCRTLKLL